MFDVGFDIDIWALLHFVNRRVNVDNVLFFMH